jgi:hypothetical protein
LKPDESPRSGPDNPRAGPEEITIPLDDDLSRYLEFLQRTKLIRHKEEAVLSALRIFKKLNMHDWMPYVYRLNDERVLMVGRGMLHDIFTSMSEAKLYDIARLTALKRRVINPMDPQLDLGEVANWGVILNGLENMGWGKFTQEDDEVMVEYLGVPIVFLKGYLETLFQVEFRIHQAMDGEVYILIRERTKPEVWR